MSIFRLAIDHPLTAHLGTPHVTTLHSVFPFDRDARTNRTGDADSFYMEWASFLPMAAISESGYHDSKKSLGLA